MNFLKKGPQLKLPTKKPDVKVPSFLSDIYYDLKERHLLPLVVVLLVAIVAIPIALSESGETTAEEGAPQAGAQASGSTQVVVAKSEPGLRDYRKRLSGLHLKDPFRDRTGGSSITPATTEEAAEPSSSPETSTSSPETSPSPPTETTPDNHHIVYYSFAIDVRVVPVSTHGKPSKAKPEVRRDLPELTMLPSRETPAIVFMGVTKDGDKALMLVSSNVKGIFGDNVCAVGGETCELLAMEPGVPETFVYGGNEKVYRIELIKVRLLRTDKLNKAPLGKPKKHKPGAS